MLGVSGFIGRGLPAALARQGWQTVGFSRQGSGRLAGVDEWRSSAEPDFAGCAAVINLAGEPIDQRWTAAKRRCFEDSRAGLTRRLVAAIAALPAPQRPRILINSSAVGIYGDRADEPLDERSRCGEGYLAGICRDWEAAALEAEALGTRVVLLRTGVVLGRDGRAFGRLVTVFRLGLGGRLGSGRQWMPWIHIDDLRGAILHALGDESLRGPVNGTAPQPERNADFTRKLARALHRPALLPVPGFALKLAMGGFGGALLQGQRALPQALLQSGYAFRHPTLESALQDLLAPQGLRS